MKIWEFEKRKCILTLSDHTQAVWSVAYHSAGDFLARNIPSPPRPLLCWPTSGLLLRLLAVGLLLRQAKQGEAAAEWVAPMRWQASGSLDHSARLWDVAAGRCKQTFRGHVDSVNEVCWQPYSNILATASSDKTVSLWDARTGLCAQTFYGHLNSCNFVTFNVRATNLASCDADGCVKIWDARMGAELLSANVGPHPVRPSASVPPAPELWSGHSAIPPDRSSSLLRHGGLADCGRSGMLGGRWGMPVRGVQANKVAFDRSGDILAVASDDGKVKFLSALTGEELAELEGHEDAVQARKCHSPERNRGRLPRFALLPVRPYASSSTCLSDARWHAIFTRCASQCQHASCLVVIRR